MKAMSLKKLLAKLLTVESRLITISYKNSSGLLIKSANVVQFLTTDDWRSLPAGGYTTVATLPVGWRPSRVLYVPEATKANAFLRIDANGAIQTYNSNTAASTMNGRYLATWIVE